MSIYPDSSFVVSLYITDAHSQIARQRMTLRPRLWLTPLHLAEFAHAVEQQIFQGRIRSVEAKRAYDALEDDLRLGVWLQLTMPEHVFESAIELAKKHVARLGCRTLDTLHVASALELGAAKFLTFDRRQEELAKAAGLDLA